MSHKLYIPNLGSLMLLAEPWTFKLYFEHRNTTMLQSYGLKKNWYWWHGDQAVSDPESYVDGEMPQIEHEPAMSEKELESSYTSYEATNASENPYIKVTLPKGTQLKVDRIYIRRGAESFSSMTFRTTKICPDKKFANKRFWAKLRDVNEIVADIIG